MSAQRVTGAQLAEAAKVTAAARVAFDAARRATVVAMELELRLSAEYASALEDWKRTLRGYESAAKERAMETAKGAA